MVNCDDVQLPPLLCRLMGRSPQQISLAFREKLAGFSKEKIPECRPSLTKREPAEELDLTGEPLDMGFDPNQEWNLSVSGEDGGLLGVRGPRLKGLKLSQARVWLSKREEKERWALVEGGENLYLGNRVDSNQTMLSKVTWAPSASLSTLSSQLDKVLEQHSMAGGRGVAKTEVSALYSFSAGEAGQLQVEAKWNRVSSILETPPLDCSVVLRVEVGEEEDGGELQLLEGFVRGLKGEGVTWVASPESRMETMLDELLEEVRSTGPRSGFTRIERTGAEEGDDETEQGSSQAAARQEEDFTDRLWSCLSHASSYAQLTEALSVVLTTISKEELRPYIYARNKTSVARMVQGLARGSDPPPLAGSLPLQMLVECGLEKLTRDASHQLVVGELATREAVQRLLGEKGEEVGLAVQRLARLQRVVQVASLTQALLPLPLEHIRGIVQSALTKLEVQQCTSFSFPLASGVVTEQLARSQTSSWQVRLTSGCVETVALYEIDLPEELMGVDGAERKGEPDENQRAEYFSIFMSTITRRTMVPGAL